MKKLNDPIINLTNLKPSSQEVYDALVIAYTTINALIDRNRQIMSALNYLMKHSPIDDNIRTAIKQAAPDDPDAAA